MYTRRLRIHIRVLCVQPQIYRIYVSLDNQAEVYIPVSMGLQHNNLLG